MILTICRIQYKWHSALDVVVLSNPQQLFVFYCGYDWPSETNASSKNDGWEYSTLADFALFLTVIVFAVGCLTAICLGIVALVQFQWLSAFVIAPVSFLYQLAFLVVFKRIAG